jgi:hypothetical protein
LLLSPLREGHRPSFEQIWILSPPRMICAKSGWNWPSGSGEEVENVKSLQTDRRSDSQTVRQSDGQTDDGQPAIRIAHLSFQLRWAKNVMLVCYSIQLWTVLHGDITNYQIQVGLLPKSAYTKGQ